MRHWPSLRIRFPRSTAWRYCRSTAINTTRAYGLCNAVSNSIQASLPAQGQIGNLLTRIGQPQKGLEQILQTIRVATPNDPTTGYWYLFAADAELELGHDRAALDWALRANAFMPGSALVQAWLASISATAGDKSNAAKSVAALTKMAPDRTRLF